MDKSGSILENTKSWRNKNMNPYYDPEKLGLRMISFDACEGGYEFDVICFWSTGDGRVYTAQDSGCSCPTPFEDYEGGTQTETIQKLEQVESIRHGIQIMESWLSRKSWVGVSPRCDWRDQAEKWLREEFSKKRELKYSPGERLIL